MTHLYKRPSAIRDAQAALEYLEQARIELENAEQALTMAGYKGAARGTHQANERVKSWAEKVRAEIRSAR